MSSGLAEALAKPGRAKPSALGAAPISGVNGHECHRRRPGRGGGRVRLPRPRGTALRLVLAASRGPRLLTSCREEGNTAWEGRGSRGPAGWLSHTTHAGCFARQPGGPSRPSHGENKEGKTSAGNGAKREALFINSGLCLRHMAPRHPGAGTWEEASRMQPLWPLLLGSECVDAFSWPQGGRMGLSGTAETPSGGRDLEGLWLEAPGVHGAGPHPGTPLSREHLLQGKLLPRAAPGHRC